MAKKQPCYKVLSDMIKEARQGVTSNLASRKAGDIMLLLEALSRSKMDAAEGQSVVSEHPDLVRFLFERGHRIVGEFAGKVFTELRSQKDAPKKKEGEAVEQTIGMGAGSDHYE